MISLEGLERRELLAADVSVTGTVERWDVDGDADGVWQSETIRYTLSLVDNIDPDGTAHDVVLTDVLDPRLAIGDVDVTVYGTLDHPAYTTYSKSYDEATHVLIIAFSNYTGHADVRIQAAADPLAPGVSGPPFTNTYAITTSEENTSPQTGGSLPFESGPLSDVELTSVTTTTPDGLASHHGGEVDYAFVVTNNSTTTTAPNAILTLDGVFAATGGVNPGWVGYQNGGNSGPIGPVIPGGPPYSVYGIGGLAPGESRTVTLVVPSAGGPSLSSTIAFRAVATADAFDPDATNNAEDVSTPLAAGADVRISVVPSPNPVRVGDDLTYGVTITNQGPDVATGLTTTQTLPAGTTFVSATLNGQPVAGSVVSGVLSIGLPDLLSGHHGTLFMTLNTAGVAASGPITLSGPIDASWNEIPSASSGVYTLGSVIPAGSLAIQLDANQTAVYVNSSLTYSYTVTNGRATDAHSVDVALTFPPASQISFVPGAYTLAQTAGGQVLTFHLSDLAAGASRTLSVQAVALPPAAGVLSVVGTIAEADRPASDYPALTLYTSVLPWTDLAVHQLPADYGKFRFVVTNNGPSPATGVYVQMDNMERVYSATRDGVPVQVKGTPAFPSPGPQPAPEVPPYFLDIGDLAVGESTVIEASVSTAGGRAYVEGNEKDFLYGNNWSQSSDGFPTVRPLDVVSGLTADASSVATGGYATFTALLTNVGPFAGHGLTLAAAIPANSTLVAASPGVVVQGNLLLFDLDYLPVGSTGGFQYVVSPTWAALPGGLTSNMGVYQTTQTVSDPASSVATATVGVFAGPSGSLVLGSASYAADPDAGSVAIVVNRVGGASGPLSLDYATSDGDAVAGVDYTPVSGTLTFADGETSKTIVVPIVNNPSRDVGRLFHFYVSTGASAVVTIPAAPPTVAAAYLRGDAGFVTAIDLEFTQPMASSSLAPANFVLVDPGRDRKFGTRDDLRIGVSPSYDRSSLAIRLRPTRLLAANRPYRLTVSGAGVAGDDGVALAGDGVRRGTDYVVELSRPPVVVHPIVRRSPLWSRSSPGLAALR